jgi:predicted enzyme related to lactoylglutathione lyase
MIRKLLPVTSTVIVFLLAAALGAGTRTAPLAAAAPAEPGRFVWRDLMAKDVGAAKKFYGDLFGWRFEDTKRGGRPYVLARSGTTLVAGIVDIRATPEAGPQWISYMEVADVDKSVAQVRADGGKIFIEPRDLPAARVAVVADPQGAPLGLAQLKRDVPDPATPTQNQFFWQEYLARDAAQALTFYKSLAGYDESITDARLGIEYHVLSKMRARAGLFQLPATSVGVEPNWLPYVLINDPSALAARVAGLGGRVILPAAPERRNGSLVVIGDPGGAPLALQKYPF